MLRGGCKHVPNCYACYSAYTACLAKRFTLTMGAACFVQPQAAQLLDHSLSGQH